MFEVTFFNAIDPASEASRSGPRGELGHYKFQARTMKAEKIREIGMLEQHVEYVGVRPCFFAVFRRPDTGAEVVCEALGSSGTEWREERGVTIEEMDRRVSQRKERTQSAPADLATYDPLDPSFGGLNSDE